MDEEVDELLAPDFKPSGKIKTRLQTYKDHGWVGVFNLWIVTNNPQPSIIYQQRGPDVKWSPLKMDVSVAGHLQTGEKVGLREAREELGKDYQTSSLTYLGKKLYIDPRPGYTIQDVIDIYMVEDNSPLENYDLQKEEVYAICRCPIKELLKAHRDSKYSFDVIGITNERRPTTISVGKGSFPFNFDNYHYKMVLLANRYFNNEKELLY